MRKLRQLAGVARVLQSGNLSRYAGRRSVTGRFERSAADLLGTRHALAVNSGTSALVCALAAVGVGPGDEVAVPAYTWVSTAAAPIALGAVPVLVEIDASLGMDPDDLERKITDRTKAVVPVHMLNLAADMDALTAVARRHGLAVVEDACQAFGVRYRGHRLGTIGDAGAFSFSQTKNIAAGEGGLVVTREDRLAARALMFHDVGSYSRQSWTPTDEALFVGLNLKMPELIAAVLVPQLQGLDARLRRMQQRRAAMIEVFAGEPSIAVAPHRAPDDAVGLALRFEDEHAAARFARARGAARLIDTERHVFTNWASIRGRRTWDPRFDPFAGRSGGFDAADLPATLDVLGRTCRVTLRDDLPVAASIAIARAQVRSYRGTRTLVRPSRRGAPG